MFNNDVFFNFTFRLLIVIMNIRIPFIGITYYYYITFDSWHVQLSLGPPMYMPTKFS